jgi:hypothetical protein
MTKNDKNNSFFLCTLEISFLVSWVSIAFFGITYIFEKETISIKEKLLYLTRNIKERRNANG